MKPSTKAMSKRVQEGHVERNIRSEYSQFQETALNGVDGKLITSGDLHYRPEPSHPGGALDESQSEPQIAP